jgi:hypothetical protein
MPKARGTKFGRKAEVAVAALLVEPTLEKAATRAGIAVRTLHDWMRQDEFMRLYRDTRRRAVERALGRLQSMADAAGATLERALTCGKPQAEIRAAEIILERSVKAVETIDILQRLEALEAQQQGRPP